MFKRQTSDRDEEGLEAEVLRPARLDELRTDNGPGSVRAEIDANRQVAEAIEADDGHGHAVIDAITRLKIAHAKGQAAKRTLEDAKIGQRSAKGEQARLRRGIETDPRAAGEAGPASDGAAPLTPPGTHEQPSAEDEAAPATSPGSGNQPPAGDAARRLWALARTARLLEERWLFWLILVCTVAAGYVFDSSAFVILRLPGGQSATDLLAGTVAMTVAAAGAMAGSALWWLLEPGAPGGRFHRRGLVVVSAIPFVFVVAVAVVSIRTAELHDRHIAAPTTALAIINCFLVAADMIASMASRQPFARAEQNATEVSEDADSAVTAAESQVLDSDIEVLTEEGTLTRAIITAIGFHTIIEPHYRRASSRFGQPPADDNATAASTDGAHEAATSDGIWPPYRKEWAAWLDQVSTTIPAPIGAHQPKTGERPTDPPAVTVHGAVDTAQHTGPVSVPTPAGAGAGASSNGNGNGD